MGLLCCGQIDLSGKDGIVGRAKSVDHGSPESAYINGLRRRRCWGIQRMLYRVGE